MATIDPDMSPGGEPPRWVKVVGIAIVIWVMLIITALVAAGIEVLLGLT